jgi:hypothetical protein
MFRKGKKLILTFGEGHDLTETEALVTCEKPLEIYLESESSQRAYTTSGPDHIVNLCDPNEKDVLTTALIHKVIDQHHLQVRPMGNREMRRFMRITTWVELSHDELSEADQVLGLDAFVQPELGQPMPDMTESQLRALADTDAASEAVLFMLKSMQAMDHKIETLATLTRQLIERTYKVQMTRQRVNLSGSGILFDHQEPYESGTVLNLRIRLPQMRHREIVAHGRVVRTDELRAPDGDSLYGIACEFIKITEADRESIISFAVQKQREALRRMRIQGDGF